MKHANRMYKFMRRPVLCSVIMKTLFKDKLLLNLLNHVYILDKFLLQYDIADVSNLALV